MKKFAITTLLLALVTVAVAQQPAFPGAEGFGMYAIGGRGGTVYEVTNLNDDGPGSFRVGVKASGPRIIVFRVSGTIELLSELKISKPYITIAGQTAPGDGICIKGQRFRVSADHVIIRYIRFRLGDEGAPEDAVWVDKGFNIILDHCSVSWALDETLSVATSESASGSSILGNVTVQWCIISESLDCSTHPKGCHGYGSLIRGAWGNGYTYHHNLYAHHRGRSPRPGNYNPAGSDPDGLIFDFRNNLVYNWGGSYAGYNADVDTVTQMNFVGNYYKAGPDSSDYWAFREQCTYSRGYFSDNCVNGYTPSDPWELVRFDGFDSSQETAYKQSSPIPVEPVYTDTPLMACGLVIADAGASYPVRDVVDTRVINDVIMGTGNIIDDQNEVGGWPLLLSADPPLDTDHDGMPDEWELAVCLDPLDPNDSSEDRTGDGYTNIEEYINWLPTGEPVPTCENENDPPIADAGPDGTAYTGLDGLAYVNLDGSGSFDSDGDPLDYYWSWTVDANACEANGVAPLIQLPLGQYDIRLVVDDGQDMSGPDYCTITIEGPLDAGMWMCPRAISCNSRHKKICVFLQLPSDIEPEDVKDQPLIMYPGEIQSTYQHAYKMGCWKNTRTVVLAVFDKDDICTALETQGQHNIDVLGQLNSGRYFCGKGSIKIESPKKYGWHNYGWNGH